MKIFILFMLTFFTYGICLWAEPGSQEECLEYLMIEPIIAIPGTDSSFISSPYPPSVVAGYQDGWKRKYNGTHEDTASTLFRICIPIIGPAVMDHRFIKRTVPDSIPHAFNPGQYMKGYQSALRFKQKVNVDVPTRVRTYRILGTIIFIELFLSAMS